jgi:hypothetical protein
MGQATKRDEQGIRIGQLLVAVLCLVIALNLVWRHMLGSGNHDSIRAAALRAMDEAGITETMTELARRVPASQLPAYAESLATVGSFAVPEQIIVDYVRGVSAAYDMMPVSDCARGARGVVDQRQTVYLLALDSAAVAAWAHARASLIKAGLTAGATMTAPTHEDLVWLRSVVTETIGPSAADEMLSSTDLKTAPDQEVCTVARGRLHAVLALPPADGARAYRILVGLRLYGRRLARQPPNRAFAAGGRVTNGRDSFVRPRAWARS